MSDGPINILQLNALIENSNFPVVIFIAGEDKYAIDETLQKILTKSAEFITNDFDKEVLYSKEKSIADILDTCSAFPFYSDRKLLVVKDFEKVTLRGNRGKKSDGELALFLNYIENPAESTIIVFTFNEKLTKADLNKEPYKSLIAKNYFFEAVPLKGSRLVDWVISECKKNKKSIQPQMAQMVIDMVGDDRLLVQKQLEKVFLYCDSDDEITYATIEQMCSQTKEYTIFDLQNEIGKKNAAKSFEIVDNLMLYGAHPVYLVFMLTKYFVSIVNLPEVSKIEHDIMKASRMLGINHYAFYDSYANARKLYSTKKLLEITDALLEADVALKTTQADGKSIITILLSKIFS